MNSQMRWRQRLESYGRMLSLLDAAINEAETTTRSIVRDGTIKRFEMTLELAWKTLKDYLIWQGIGGSTGGARTVIKEAFAADLLPNAQLWIEMLETRNTVTHCYDVAVFEVAYRRIEEAYLAELTTLHTRLLGEV